ncbi:hypothetical protein BWQ96_01985 [Gracilariopsis chorda]|uniref:Carbamoyltransferase domain-containing protein n=1 Tax=Gracilariopsis chorda TaxID=448386 RepID=A0A2V3J1K0_9FLOR|nr:hypothetical protein BWQ96_01985 [Gracilariopsis chorda]|eukprot:PXF48296.1 hypothetical protein BWQ96_01985 [Gracilariopsis chorda]
MDALTTEDESPEEIASRVKLVVANNHHFRILPFEQRLPFQVSMNYVPSSYLSPWNLIGSPVRYLQQSEMYAPEATKVELSHHLAHAFSAVFACPFDRGLVVIMDGMGDSLDDWLAARCRDERHYFCESSCPLFVRDAPDFREFPKDVGHRPGISFREAETAYVFERRHDGVHFSRVYKRWTPENAPSELANHSFEEMDSIGAMYSRVSALIFKDWNNCGKVMGLAPYGQKESDSFEDKRLFIHGHLYDGSIEMDTGRMIGMTHSSKSMADCDDTSEGKRLRHYFEQLAHRMQRDLEVTVADFISNLIDQTGEQNLILAGGSH